MRINICDICGRLIDEGETEYFQISEDSVHEACQRCFVKLKHKQDEIKKEYKKIHSKEIEKIIDSIKQTSEFFGKSKV
jgi:formylmethanofuran dehydrogenase subunit B